MGSLRVASIALVTVSIAASAIADVLVVRQNGSLPEIQAAVDAASDGDTILVRSGAYAAVVLGDKTLTIVADDGASATVTGGIRVNGLAVARDVVLSGLDVQGSAAGSAGLDVVACAGSVRIQGCTLSGSAQASAPHDGFAGASIDASSDVTFAACTLLGASPTFAAADGGIGLRVASASNVAGYALQADGGSVSTRVPSTCAGVGGNGTSVTSGSFAFFGALSCRGGNGGPGAFGGGCSCNDGGAGGHGVRVSAAPSEAIALASQFHGGVGGPAGIGCGLCGSCAVNGQPGFDVSGNVQLPFGAARLISAPRIARAGTSVIVNVHGTESLEGEEVFLVVAHGTAFEYSAPLKGVRLTQNVGGTTRLRRPARDVDDAGVLHIALAIPSLPAGVEARNLYVQTLHRAGGVWRLGGFATIVVVEGSF